MKKLSSLTIAKSQIEIFFKKYRGCSYGADELGRILTEKRSSWNIAPSTSTKKFADFLIAERLLEIAALGFRYKRFVRYIRHDCSILEIASSLMRNAYLSHFSAVAVHDLTEQLPKSAYLNVEQGFKGHRQTRLTQARIDFAFSRPWRVSNNLARYKDASVFLLNGMHTGNLGVTQAETATGQIVRVTDIERTLIDIAVRPIYSGGIFEVLKAYRAAIKKIDIDKLIGYLESIGYIYPYHQVIGFYLERAGIQANQLRPLKDISMDFDFYLTHQIKMKEYSKEWRLYYPSGF